MDTSGLIPAFAAILGSTVGGLTTFGTTFLTQRYTARRDIREKDLANREKLYSEFLREVADLYIDSLSRTLVDVGKPAAFVEAYALLGRIRMISTEAVLNAAERVIHDIIDSYNRPPITIEELKRITDERPADPWHQFTEACRAERETLLRRL
jgi:hypothetical protein